LKRERPETSNNS